MDASVIVNHEDFLLLEKEWGDLIFKIGKELTVFATHQWYRCWLDNYLKESQLFIVVIRNSGALVGIAPLHIVVTKHRGLPVRKLKFIENGNSLHNDFIVDPDERKQCLPLILDFLFNNRSLWDFVEFVNLLEISSSFPLLNQYLKRKKNKFGVRPGLNSPCLEIKGNWDDYYSSRSRKSKKTLRSINNQINRAGISEVIHIDNYDDYLKIREELFYVAKNSWTEEIGDSINSVANRTFFEDLIEVSSEKGWLSIWGLRIDHKLVAFEIHLVYGHVAHGLRASFLKQMINISPGAYLDRSIIENMFKNTDRESIYDFGGSFDNYKRKWTNKIRSHKNISIYNPSIYSRFHYWYENLLIALLRRGRDFLRRLVK